MKTSLTCNEDKEPGSGQRKENSSLAIGNISFFVFLFPVRAIKDLTRTVLEVTRELDCCVCRSCLLPAKALLNR